ncbi:enolase C-terminal domain-like protein [Alicyclobacillus fastidiosus]|nr:enolase C-terminal domain-like protein [Alicyclobacillus fastidiosus]GMA61342.1 hypothetical protein GCM10025859_17820 [Alicyclobacillus fastidiosus]
MFVHATYGGVLLLAHAGRQPVGSLFSFPSLYRGEWVLWSHETAVLPEFLHQGIGYQLKLMQRQIAAEMGYQSIAWTFDPLVSRNAHFNMNKLGASIAEYKVNVYGTMENDLVEQGLPSDRWIAVWPVATVVSQGPTDLGMRALEQIPIVLNVDEAGEPRLNENSNRISDIDHIKKWDVLNLMMIEQPLASDDIVDHAHLQAAIRTPICLDESIRSAEDLRKAVRLGSCKVVNLKVGRVGGFGESLVIHKLCQEAGLDLWCGGMEETGIGRLHNIALTALPGFTLPGDTAPSTRYFEEDIIDPPVAFTKPGILKVEPLAGVASRVQADRLKKCVLDKLVIETKVGVVG